MRSPAEHLAMVARALDGGRHLLQGGFFDKAGREAYLAAFQAALAIIVSETGQEPKTHKGTHTEFARLSMVVPGLDRSFSAFIKHNYTLKVVADYEGDPPVSEEEARRALNDAEGIVQAIASLLNPSLDRPTP